MSNVKKHRTTNVSFGKLVLLHLNETNIFWIIEFYLSLGVTGNIEQTLKGMQETKESRLRQYGDYMPSLIRDLEMAHKRGQLSKVPIGPFGNHIEVTVPKYRQYIEDVIGKMTMAFCCNSANDANNVRKIIQKYSKAAQRITVLTSKFIDQAYDVGNNSVQPNKHSLRIMDGIRVDNVMVLNLLIDMCNIDRVLLTESTDFAEQITSRKENVPRNLLRIIVTKPYAEYYPAPMYRSYSKTTQHQKLLRVSEADRGAMQKNELIALNKRIEDTDAECNAIRGKIAENQKRIDERTQTILRAEKIFRNRQLEINELQSHEFQGSVDTTAMVSSTFLTIF